MSPLPVLSSQQHEQQQQTALLPPRQSIPPPLQGINGGAIPIPKRGTGTKRTSTALSRSSTMLDTGSRLYRSGSITSLQSLPIASQSSQSEVGSSVRKFSGDTSISCLSLSPDHELDGASADQGAVGSSASEASYTSSNTNSTSCTVTAKTATATTLIVPARSLSMKSTTVEELLDLGASLFAPPNQQYSEALDKWKMALDTAQKEYDLFGQARALSNIGCAYRALSLFEDALIHQQKSWRASIAYCKQRYAKLSGSIPTNDYWFEMVNRTLDLDNPDVYAMELEDHADPLSEAVAGLSFSNSDAFISSRSLPSSPSSTSSSSAAVSSGEPFRGPPLVVWFMQLATNLGNAYFNLGKFEHSVNWHSKCLQLTEVVLEENALPPNFDKTTSYENAQHHHYQQKKSVFSGIGGGAAGTTRMSMLMSNNPKGDRIKLSYLHHATLLAQTRSLVHIGICCQHLGLDDSSLQCHSHASSIIAFYASRSPSFTYQDSGSFPSKAGGATVANKTQAEVENSNPQLKPWQASQLGTYQAVINANLATAYHSKGRLPSAIERLERAAKQFKKDQDVVGEARCLASLGAMKIEVGRVLGSLHWIRNMELQAVGTGEVNECMRYWGPPRLKGVNLNSGEWDESASISAGSQWVLQGIQIMLEQLKVLKEKNDIFGILTTLLNIASGYITEKHPYMALQTISRLLTEETSYSSGCNEGDSMSKNRTIPQFFHLHTCFTLCQAVFLLTRLQLRPEQPLYPGPISDELDGFPTFDANPINRVLEVLGLGYVTIDLPELDLFIAGYLGAQEIVLLNRQQVQASPSYSILYTYIGGEYSSDTQRTEGLNTSGTISRDPAGIAKLMGVGTGMDSMKQRAALTSAMGGKADWLLGSKYDLVFNERQARDHYLQGTGKLDRAAKETVKALTGTASGALPSSLLSSTPPSSSSPTNASSGKDSNNTAAAESGLIASFFGLSGAAYAVPPVNPSAPPAYHHALPCYSPVVTPSLRASLLVTPSLFALAADTMAFAAYQLQARAGAVGAATGCDKSAASMAVAAAAAVNGLDLLRILRIPQQAGPSKVHRELLSAAACLYSTVLGWCENCMREALGEPDYGIDVVYVGREGRIGLLAEKQEQSDRDRTEGLSRSATTGSTGSTSSQDSLRPNQFKFPCDHYFWK